MFSYSECIKPFTCETKKGVNSQSSSTVKVRKGGLVELCSCHEVDGLFNNLMQASSLFITFSVVFSSFSIITKQPENSSKVLSDRTFSN